MPKLEFFGQSLRDDDNTGAAPSRLFNCYREQTGGRSAVLKAVPGTKMFTDVDGVLLRDLKMLDGVLYAAIGTKIVRVSQAGTVTELGTIKNSADTTISHNNGNIAIVAGGEYWVWDGSTFEQPAAGAFNSFTDVVTFGQRTVLLERGRRLQWSGVTDPKTLDGLDFATAESSDSDALRIMVIGDVLHVFKSDRIERWYKTGSGDSSLFIAPITGGATHRGLLSRSLLTEIPDGAFYIGSDGKAWLIGGGESRPVSTIAVETSIATSWPSSVGFYRDEGHEFCVVRFDNRPAWVLDISTGEWHERGEGEYAPWSLTHISEGYSGFVGGTDRGELVHLGPYFKDYNGPLIRDAIGRTLDNGFRGFRVARAELMGNVGAIDLTGSDDGILAVEGGFVLVDGAPLAVEGVVPDDAAKVILRASADYGKTWQAPRVGDFGRLGEYNTRCVFRSLGRFERFTPRVTWADPQNVTIDAIMDVEIA